VAEGVEAPQAPGPNNPDPNDFSEFLWMEHEEEYDEQVMKELEDEEMLNYYFDLYEDTLEAEANGQIVNGPSFPPPQSCELPRELAREMSRELAREIPRGGQQGDDLSRDFNRVMTFSSNLNPDAAEFVPGGQGRTNEIPCPTSSS